MPKQAITQHTMLFLDDCLGAQGGLVKRVDFDPSNNAIELISANPAYETCRYSGNGLENIRITGWVVVCWHKM